MKQITFFFIAILIAQTSFAQSKNTKDKIAINKVIKTFMQCLEQKDSIKFYALFHTDPVVWGGVIHNKTFLNELKKDSSTKDNFKSNYKSFYRHFYTKDIKENFYNIQIIENGYIATVMFDYSFWEKGIKKNWGKESWGLIKTNGDWKITSVLFSTEDEKINSEPRR